MQNVSDLHLENEHDSQGNGNHDNSHGQLFEHVQLGGLTGHL